MTSFYYKARKVKEPILNVTCEQAENYGTSLNALNQAWSSITATKKELRTINSKIRQSVVSPAHYFHDDDRENRQLPPFPRKDPNIERRIVYENYENPTHDYTTYRKENIPPQSYPQPTFQHHVTKKEYLLKQELEPPTVDHLHSAENHLATAQHNYKANTSLVGRSLLAKERKSEALKRLKDRINQQKENSSSFNEDNSFPEKLNHVEDEIVKISEEVLPPMVRKVGAAPSAPTYKGFNQPNTTFTKATVPHNETEKQGKSKDSRKLVAQKEKKGTRHVKIGKVGKKQRIVAPKKSANVITTSTWRVGLELQKQMKKELISAQGNNKQTHLKKKKAHSETENLHTQASSISTDPRHTLEKSTVVQSESEIEQISNNDAPTVTEDNSKIRSDHDTSKNDKKAEDRQSNELSTQKSKSDEIEKGDKDVDITDEDISSLKENPVLSKNAKDVLAEIQSKHVSEKEKGSDSVDKKKKVKAVVDTGLNKRRSVHDKRSPPVKRKLDVETFASRKVRHYDQSEVQKYMIKQQAERKRQRLEELEKEKQQRKLQQNKLKELFEKQKAAVKESSKQRRNHMLGSTFTKQKQLQDMRGNDITRQGMKQYDNLFRNEFQDALTSDEMSCVQKDASYEPRSLTTTSLPMHSSDTDTDTLEEFSKIDHSVESKKQDVYETAKADRVAAIRATAAALRERLNMESKRLNELVHSKKQLTIESSFHQQIDVDDQHQTYQYPGVHNIDSQAALNVRLYEMEVAAKKIQALYRGHSVRQNLHSWQLPSGRTLHQTLEEGRRRAFLSDLQNKQPVKLASDHRPPVKVNSDIRSPVRISPNYEGQEEGTSSQSSVTSLISEALIHSKSLLEDADKSLSRVSTKSQVSERDGGFPSYNSYRESNNHHQHSTTTSASSSAPTTTSNDPNERLRKILEKYKDVPADKYSVINIFTRNYPSLRKQQLTQELSPAGTETENLLADAYAHERKDDTSLDEYLSEQELDDDNLTEQDFNNRSNSEDSTLTAPQSSILDQQATNKDLSQKTSSQPSPPTQLSYRSLLSPKPKRTMSSSSDVSEKLFSPTPETVKTKSLEEIPHKSDERIQSMVYATDEESLTSTQRSPTLFSDTGNEDEINPVLTSTKRSPKGTKQDVGHDGTPLTHNVNFNRRDRRLSPNALERRLRAELNLFDSVGDSLQQINEMDKIRDIVQAQQETVSLAQVIKQRQLSHQQEIDKMSLEARERAAKSAQNIETAKRNAAEAAANAMKAIAEIKTKAADDVAQSTKQLAYVQNEATTLSLNAMKQTEQARQHAFDAYEHSVEKRLSNVENVVTAAASAASGAAVEVALTHYRERLETLRKQSLQKVSESYTSSTTTTESKSSRRSKTSNSSSPSSSRESSNRTITEDVPLDISKQKDDSKIFSKLSTLRNASDSQDDGMDGVSEDLPPAEDHELSEALFSTGKKQITSAADESIHSNYSEEKFHSSLTEDELKRDFRQVLPSENHRRKSLDHRDYIISGNETSSDELVTPRNVGKSSLKKHSKSPFVDEDTFTRFTADMVRQYVHEEEVRAKHQAALLGLREKAIVEKTKAEMAYLEMQKKSLKKKGVDEKMPPIAKKQRALMMKLEAEQAEIRRLKQAHKAASDERLFMLQQEQEIRQIQKSTQNIWNEVGSYKDVSKHNTYGTTPDDKVSETSPLVPKNATDDTISEATVLEEKLSTAELSVPDASISTAKDDSFASKKDEISEEISREKKSAATPSESYSSSKEKRTSTPNEQSVGNTEKTNEDLSSVSHDLKKLKHMASKKYLTEREKKLEARKQKFSEIMERESKLKTWRQKIVEEELRLKADIKKVLHHGVSKTDETHEHEDSFEDSTLTEGHSRKSKKHSSTSSAKRNEHADISQQQSPPFLANDASSITEDSTLDKEVAEKSESVESQSSNKGSTASKVSEALSYRSETKSHTTVKPTVTEQSPSNVESFVYSNTFEELTKSNKLLSLKERRNEEDSWTEGTSDASDTEQRLKALEHELRRRRTELQKLRKKKEKETLRRKEQQLKKELQAVEQQIHCESKDNWTTESAHTKVSPRVLSPRTSLDTVILPEKIKIPSDKEFRRSLDFSDKESDNEKTVSSRDSGSDVSTSSRASNKESKVQSIEKEKSTATPPATQLVDQDSIDEISENIAVQDHSNASIISEDVKTVKSTIIDEPSSRSARKSTKSLENIYDDDFFESESVKNEKESSIQEVLSKHDSSSSIHEDFSKHDKSSSIQENLNVHDKSSSEASSKHSNRQSIHASSSQGVNNKSSIKTASFDGTQSKQYSSRFESDVDDKSESSARETEIVEVSIASRESISERLSSTTHGKGSEKMITQAISTEERKHVTEERPPPSVRDFVTNDESISEKSKSQLSSDKRSTTFSNHSSSKSTTTAEIIQPDEFSKSNVSSVLGFRVNDRVKVEDVMFGTIRYLGKAAFSPVLVVGVELDQPCGTNNGTFQGKQYFRCPEDHGLFTTIEKLKLFDEEVASKNVSDVSESSSTVQEVDESLEELKSAGEESYSEDFEPTSVKSQSRGTPDKLTSIHESMNSSSSPSSHSVKVAEDINLIEELAKDSLSKEKDGGDSTGTIDELDLRSSSDVESLSGGEIPSPTKLDVQPLVDSITDGIMKSIISETVAVVSPRPPNNDGAGKADELNLSNERLTVKTVSPPVKQQQQQQQSTEPAEFAAKKLLSDALNVMLNVMKEKDDKLLEQEDRVKKHARDDIFSMLTNDDEMGILDDDGDRYTNKLNHLKDVHDQLGMLLGDDDDDDLDDEAETEAHLSKVVEEKLKVPINEKDTLHMVSLALDEINKHETDTDALSRLQVPESILAMPLDDEELDEQNTLLYKTLVFDMTLYLYNEIKSFGELQATKRAPWLKIPRKTFSKFVRKTHAFNEDLSERLSHFVCACMDLQEGRPSLLHIKRKLPLNLAKKDYVDAVLVEELREEEAQWVNYDEDELRVKFQLADNILDSLLAETVHVINNILDVS